MFGILESFQTDLCATETASRNPLGVPTPDVRVAEWKPLAVEALPHLGALHLALLGERGE